MKITEIVIRKLEPEEGMKLTNGIDVAENEVILGKGDMPENWHEITKEEYENILKNSEDEDYDI